jgi:predicted aspartyl protease
MKHHAIFGSAMVACATLLSTSALAADCGPLKLLSTIKMTPADNNPDEVRLIPVTVNDQTKTFLFDTGGAMTQISRKAAEDLKLDIVNSNIQMYDVNGNISRKAATADKLVVGRMAFSHVFMPVTPFEGMDGLISSNMLVNYDIDLDFPNNVMNYISRDHCPGAVMYWKADAIGVAPMHLVGNTRITVKVTLDGQTFDAFIDTGATTTVLSDKVAKYFLHVPLGAPGDKPVDNINGEKTLKAYIHTFSKLTFGGVTIENPKIMILEDRMNRNGDKFQQTGNRALSNNAEIVLPNMVIGMNMLKDLHVYIAFGENRLYLTQTKAAGAAAPPVGATAAAAAKP